MKRLYVLYDGECRLCRRVRAWLERQPAYVELACLPLQSSEVRRRFPGIEAFHPNERLIVVSDAGALWRGDSAWITVLWALREYREWASRLAHPTLRPFARQACAIVSENRHRLSEWLRRAPHRDLHQTLSARHEDRDECHHHSTRPIPCQRP